MSLHHGSGAQVEGSAGSVNAHGPDQSHGGVPPVPEGGSTQTAFGGRNVQPEKNQGEKQASATDPSPSSAQVHAPKIKQSTEALKVPHTPLGLTHQNLPRCCAINDKKKRCGSARVRGSLWFCSLHNHLHGVPDTAIPYNPENCDERWFSVLPAKVVRKLKEQCELFKIHSDNDSPTAKDVSSSKRPGGPPVNRPVSATSANASSGKPPIPQGSTTPGAKPQGGASELPFSRDESPHSELKERLNAEGERRAAEYFEKTGKVGSHYWHEDGHAVWRVSGDGVTPTCLAFGRDGEQCKNARKGRFFCHIPAHQKQLVPELQQGRPWIDTSSSPGVPPGESPLITPKVNKRSSSPATPMGSGVPPKKDSRHNFPVNSRYESPLVFDAFKSVKPNLTGAFKPKPKCGDASCTEESCSGSDSDPEAPVVGAPVTQALHAMQRGEQKLAVGLSPTRRFAMLVERKLEVMELHRRMFARRVFAKQKSKVVAGRWQQLTLAGWDVITAAQVSEAKNQYAKDKAAEKKEKRRLRKGGGGPGGGGDGSSSSSSSSNSAIFDPIGDIDKLRRLP